MISKCNIVNSDGTSWNIFNWQWYSIHCPSTGSSTTKYNDQIGGGGAFKSKFISAYTLLLVWYQWHHYCLFQLYKLLFMKTLHLFDLCVRYIQSASQWQGHPSWLIIHSELHWEWCLVLWPNRWQPLHFIGRSWLHEPLRCFSWQYSQASLSHLGSCGGSRWDIVS